MEKTKDAQSTETTKNTASDPAPGGGKILTAPSDPASGVEKILTAPSDPAHGVEKILTAPSDPAPGRGKIFTSPQTARIALAAFCALLLCLNIAGLYYIINSQNELAALQKRIDELSSIATASQNRSNLAEINALREKIDELYLISAELEEKSNNLSGSARTSLASGSASAQTPGSQTPESQRYTGMPGQNIPLGTWPDGMEEDEAARAAAQAAASATAQAGQTVTVTVSAPQINDLYGYELKVRFDPEYAAYSGGLKSGITEIPTIFHKEFDGYILIGATMIGDAEGYTAVEGVKTEICALSFTALKEFKLSELTIDSVNIVNGNLEYKENIANWEIKAVME